MNIESPLSDPASSFTIATIDSYIISAAAIAAGDVLPLPASSVLQGTTISGITTASAAQRKSSTPCVALEAATASGQRIRVRVQGRCKALTKSTGNNAIAIGDRLCFGTAKAAEADAPTVNTNRWIAYADEAFAAGSSSTPALKDVVLMGPAGLGMQGAGT